ncbi:MAG: thioredoxin domain-containing protein [Terriglobia bacterium]
MPEDASSNSLACARSSYLRSAGHQPVAWQEWSDQAFERARTEDKPILLDIGAVWCHWCHVMDRESYENPEIASLINQHFVAIKVDRDERPDIDARYQLAVSALTGQGGWPLTAFLTPEGKPFFGGTYFPPEDMQGRPGMIRVLESIAHHYGTNKSEILSSAENITAALGNLEAFRKDGSEAGAALVDQILENIGKNFDPDHGGFGSQPKFPHPGAMDLVMDAYLETRQTWLLEMAERTLEAMGKGGVYDQIGGGFHRYSVDDRWIVPHFEKMSYDNAALLVNYLRAFQITGKEFFREIAVGILGFIQTVLVSPGGGFYASQDADMNLDDDGDYFTWTLEEIRAALDSMETEVAAERYHVEEQGEMQHHPEKNVLFIDQPVEAIAARLKLSPSQVSESLHRAKAKLLAARSARPTPFVDKTIYISWNGMMISAFIEAYRVMGLESKRNEALKALDLLMERAFDPTLGMYHSLVEDEGEAQGRAEIEGLIEDQVFTIHALLDGFEVTGRRHYFDRALELMEITLRRFWDGENGGFFDTASDREAKQGSLKLARKAFQDSPTPAANSVAALALDRLAAWAERPDYHEKAGQTLSLFAAKAAGYGLYAATFGLAVANHHRTVVDVVVIGDRKDERTRQLLRAAYGVQRAGIRVLLTEPSTVKDAKLPPGLAATLPHVPLAGDDSPVALVCLGNTCKPPVRTPEDLTAAIG